MSVEAIILYLQDICIIYFLLESSQNIYAVIKPFNKNTHAVNAHYYQVDWISLPIRFVILASVQLLHEVL